MVCRGVLHGCSVVPSLNTTEARSLDPSVDANYRLQQTLIMKIKGKKNYQKTKDVTKEKRLKWSWLLKQCLYFLLNNLTVSQFIIYYRHEPIVIPSLCTELVGYTLFSVVKSCFIVYRRHPPRHELCILSSKNLSLQSSRHLFTFY